MHDRIDESLNDVRSSCWYEDFDDYQSYDAFSSYRYEYNQFYESVWSLNWFEIVYRLKCFHIDLKIDNHFVILS
jgi:hypothetical protein